MPEGEEGEPRKAPTRVPEDTAGRFVDKVPARYSSKGIYSTQGNRIRTVTMHGKNAQSRTRGWAEIEREIRSVARSQSHHDKRVKFTVIISNGQELNIGDHSGYFASDLMPGIKGGVENFIVGEASKRNQLGSSPLSVDLTSGEHRIVSVQVNSYNAPGLAWNSNKADHPKRTRPKRPHRQS